MSQPESYNPERSFAEGGRSRRERNMAEGASPQEISLTPPPALPGQGGSTENQPVIAQNRPWHISPGYDPNRQDYVTHKEDIYDVIVDPKTGKEVARIAQQIADGDFLRGGDKSKRPDPKKPTPPLTPQQPEVTPTGQTPDTGTTSSAAPSRTATETGQPVHTETTPAAGGTGHTGGAEHGAGTGGGGPEGPRESQSPERDWGFPEDLWSPEFRARGISIASRLKVLEQQYKEERTTGNRLKLDDLFEEWTAWSRKDEHRSFTRKPFKPPLEQAGPTQVVPPEQHDNLTNPDGTLLLLTELTEAHAARRRNAATTPAELRAIEKDLSRFFNEAKKRGLLDGVDASLRQIYVVIKKGTDQGGHQLAPDEIWSSVRHRREIMVDLARTAFEEVYDSSPALDKAELAKLANVWDVYIDLAIKRFAVLVDRGRQKGSAAIRSTSIDGEFDFKIEDNIDSLGAKGIEAYRQLAQEGETFWRPTWGKYFEVTAKRPLEFQLALDTFAQWMRSGITKDPAEMFTLVQGFKEAFTSATLRTAGLPEGFAERTRRQMEALVGVMGADWSNEHYNDDYFRQFWTLIAKEEGPARLAGLAKVANGKLAAVLWKLDKDPSLELLFTPYGSGGQLMRERNGLAMDKLHEHLMNILITEMIGVEIKGYDPRDPTKALAGQAFDENLNNLVRFQSDEEFKGLFEGFDQAEQNRLYLELKDKGVNGLKPAEKSLLERLETAGRIQRHLTKGKSISELKTEDRGLYQEAAGAVKLAFELYGVMGEKARRGGGVFLVDKQDGKGRKYFDYIPTHWAEKFVQFAENWTKAEYGYLPAAFVEKKVAQARKMALWALKKDGCDAELFDFTLYKAGVIEDSSKIIIGYEEENPVTLAGLKLFDLAQYRQHNPVNIPGYQRASQYTATLFDVNGNPVDIKFERDKLVCLRREIIDPETFLGLDRFHQQLYPNILGFDKDGQSVTLTFDQEGKPVGIPFDQSGKAEIYNKPTGAERQRINFQDSDGNSLSKDTRANRMNVKTPTGSEAVDFQIATHHLYSRWTSHHYWGYQEQNTGLVIDKEAFADAQKIKQGLLRPEDAKPHAVQLLLIDPTLERVAHFLHQEKREDKIMLAAVEDSNQGHWRITDQLHQMFLPDNANDNDIRLELGLQDFGGSTKEWLNIRAKATRWTDSSVRRLRTLTAFLPLHFASMSETWGAPNGTLDVLRMMHYGADENENGGGAGGYRMVGQFALEKWIRQTAYAQYIKETLEGFVSDQEKRSREGLGEKPTNDADALQRWFNKLISVLKSSTSKDEEVENQFINAVRESLGRFEKVFQAIRVMETDVRGDRGPLWLQGTDIFKRKENGSYETDQYGLKVFNREIDKMRSTGSSRHSSEIFFWRFVRWLRSHKEDEGAALYPTEDLYYELMDKYTFASVRIALRPDNDYDKKKLVTRWQWLLGKLVR